MAKAKIEGLISDLHDKFGSDITSREQREMIEKMEAELDEWQGQKPRDMTFVETAEMLREELEEDHPKAAAIIHEIIEILNNIGV